MAPSKDQATDMPGRETYEVHPNKDGSITLQYHPKDAGIHELNLSHNDKQCDGTPFRCHVDGHGGHFVTAYGPGLSFAASGQEAEFTVVGGGSKIDIHIDGPSKTELHKKEAHGSTHCSYAPMSPGEYMIAIKSGGKHIHGSPFSAKVSGEGHKRSQLVLSKRSNITLGGTDVDLAGLVGNMKTPSGGNEPVLLKKMPGGALGIASFAPKSRGSYAVDVKLDGKPFKGSPFKVDVSDSQVASAGKVVLHGAFKEMESGKWNEMSVDLGHAGFGTLSLSLEGAHRAEIEEMSFDNNVYKLRVRPHEPGLYQFNIRFADDHVTGSPIMLCVSGKPSGRVRETITKDIAAADPIGPGSRCEFQLKIPGTDALEMEASLTSPSGKTELCEISDLPGHLYDIKFSPKEEGVHTVSLKHRGIHISGSPFQYTVGAPPNAGAYKVEIGGPGLEKGEVSKPNDFNIYTREAGGGKLSIAIEGPSKAVLDVVDRGNGYTTVSYVVKEAGDYGVHVKYNDEHVPDSPTNVHIVPHSEGANKVCISGLRDRGLEVGKHVTFHVNKSGAKGELKAYLDTPSGQEEDIFLQEMDRDLHAVRFIPKENGVYYVHIKLNEAHINGSPFPMIIGQLGADPALVLASGDGLSKAACGSQAKFKVNTANAGAGALLVVITGPAKLAIQCAEVEDGYEFMYTPMSPGDYFVNIKFCNITIAGCPTKVTCTGADNQPAGKGKGSSITETSSLAVETVDKKEGASTKKRFHGDASKVVVKGNGLKKAFFNRVANFTIDVKGAGNALLTAGMMTCTGNPVEEFGLKKTRGTAYTGSFKTKEKGDHTLTIRWGPDDVPGSPFTIPAS